MVNKMRYCIVLQINSKSSSSSHSIVAQAITRLKFGIALNFLGLLGIEYRVIAQDKEDSKYHIGTKKTNLVPHRNLTDQLENQAPLSEVLLLDLTSISLQ
jgi:hypothetical protein